MQQDAEELYSSLVNTLSQSLKEVRTGVLSLWCDGGAATLLAGTLVGR